MTIDGSQWRSYESGKATGMDIKAFPLKQNVEAAEAARFTVVSSHTNLFNPHGVSGVVIIAESHITIHTWPENEYAAVDVFTCGDKNSGWKIREYLEQTLKAKRCSAVELNRGLFEEQK
jgi:S-adenosylmethionine decarboxylase proenzyme